MEVSTSWRTLGHEEVLASRATPTGWARGPPTHARPHTFVDPACKSLAMITSALLRIIWLTAARVPVQLRIYGLFELGPHTSRVSNYVPGPYAAHRANSMLSPRNTSAGSVSDVIPRRVIICTRVPLFKG